MYATVRSYSRGRRREGRLRRHAQSLVPPRPHPVPGQPLVRESMRLRRQTKRLDRVDRPCVGRLGTRERPLGRCPRADRIRRCGPAGRLDGCRDVRPSVTAPRAAGSRRPSRWCRAHRSRRAGSRRRSPLRVPPGWRRRPRSGPSPPARRTPMMTASRAPARPLRASSRLPFTDAQVVSAYDCSRMRVACATGSRSSTTSMRAGSSTRVRVRHARGPADAGCGPSRRRGRFGRASSGRRSPGAWPGGSASSSGVSSSSRWRIVKAADSSVLVAATASRSSVTAAGPNWASAKSTSCPASWIRSSVAISRALACRASVGGSTGVASTASAAGPAISRPPEAAPQQVPPGGEERQGHDRAEPDPAASVMGSTVPPPPGIGVGVAGAGAGGSEAAWLTLAAPSSWMVRTIASAKSPPGGPAPACR